MYKNYSLSLFTITNDIASVIFRVTSFASLKGKYEYYYFLSPPTYAADYLKLQSKDYKYYKSVMKIRKRQIIRLPVNKRRFISDVVYNI